MMARGFMLDKAVLNSSQWTHDGDMVKTINKEDIWRNCTKKLLVPSRITFNVGT